MSETDVAQGGAELQLTRLEDLTPGARVRGVLPDRAVTVVQVEWHGTQALTLTYRDDAGKVDHELLYRPNEATRPGGREVASAQRVCAAACRDLPRAGCEQRRRRSRERRVERRRCEYGEAGENRAHARRATALAGERAGLRVGLTGAASTATSVSSSVHLRADSQRPHVRS